MIYLQAISLHFTLQYNQDKKLDFVEPLIEEGQKQHQRFLTQNVC